MIVCYLSFVFVSDDDDQGSNPLSSWNLLPALQA